MIRIATLSAAFLALAALSPRAATFTVDAAHPSGQVSPTFFGLMTEEINHSYDGGLYGELIQNRAFLDDPATPVHWSLVSDSESAAEMALDPANPLNDQLTNSLRITVAKAAPGHVAGAANGGYWGIPVQPSTTYGATLFAKTKPGFTGWITVAIVSDDGKTLFAEKKIPSPGADWKKLQVSLSTGRAPATAQAHLAVTLDQPGTLWLGMVSLFPPTWDNQPNGFRKDLMQMMVDLNPKFLRFPGGNYLEGDTVETRFDWKKTLGPIEERRGHQCPWGYRSTDGLGLLEFLRWCEDMKADPVLAVYAGYSLGGKHINPGPDLEPFIQDALDEIEYVTGDASTTWGARRIQDGHRAPFKLTYVEIGNEDWFDKSGSYDARYAQFDKAIKAKYPKLKLISTIGNDQPETNRVHSLQPDVTDEHYYKSTDEFLASSPDYAKAYDRNGPEIFVGEWAAHEDAKVRPWYPESKPLPPTPTFKAALGDGIFLAAMERNSDLIKMNCYAPMFVNVNPGARQWRPNLIGYDAQSAFGSPSYYAIQLFSRNLGDQILPVTAADTAVQGSATRDSKTGEIIVKLVNAGAEAVPLTLNINGLASLDSKGTAITLTGKLEDLNTITEPKKIAPVTTSITGVKSGFTYALPPYSIVALKLKGR